MTKAQFIPLVKGMKAVYADPAFLTDADAILVWYSLLKDFTYESVSKAIQEVMRTSRFKPTVADIIERIHVAETPEQLTAPEAWSLVRRAMRNSIYGAEAEFEKLPAACRRAIGSPESLRELATMDEDTVESVQQSHFIKTYRAVTEKSAREERATLPQHLQNIQKLEELQERTAKALENSKNQQISAVNRQIAPQNVEKPVDYAEIDRRIEEMFTEKRGDTQCKS